MTKAAVFIGCAAVGIALIWKFEPARQAAAISAPTVKSTNALINDNLQAPTRPTGGGLVYKAQPGGKIRIDGDSSIHEWYMLGTMIGGSFELPPGVKIDTAKESIEGMKDNFLDAKVQAIVTVRSVHSVAAVGASIMDGLYQDALREKENPKILYNATALKLKAGHLAGKPFEFDTRGELSIAGVTNKISMPVTIECVEANKIKITGSVPLKMTDFKVQPPAPNIGMGAMRCKDGVKISFEWILAAPAQ